MGMQQKLQKAYNDGFADGQKVANEQARLFGQIEGAHETFDLIEKMFININGIGPKTKEKIMLEIKKYAMAEKERLKNER